MIFAEVLEYVAAMAVPENRGAGSKERLGGTKKRTTN